MPEITKVLIKNTFIKLYKQKGMEQITIKQLCQEVPVARTTFYSYYENLDDVLSEIEDEFVNGIKLLAKTMSAGNVENLDFTAYFNAVMTHIKDNWETVEALLVIYPDIRFMEKWKKAIKYHFKIQLPNKVMIMNYNLIAEAIACSVLGAYAHWIKHPEEFNAKELSRVTQAMISVIDELI